MHTKIEIYAICLFLICCLTSCYDNEKIAEQVEGKWSGTYVNNDGQTGEYAIYYLKEPNKNGGYFKQCFNIPVSKYLEEMILDRVEEKVEGVTDVLGLLSSSVWLLKEAYFVGAGIKGEIFICIEGEWEVAGGKIFLTNDFSTLEIDNSGIKMYWLSGDGTSISNDTKEVINEIFTQYIQSIDVYKNIEVKNQSLSYSCDNDFDSFEIILHRMEDDE